MSQLPLSKTSVPTDQWPDTSVKRTHAHVNGSRRDQPASKTSDIAFAPDQTSSPSLTHDGSAFDRVSTDHIFPPSPLNLQTGPFSTTYLDPAHHPEHLISPTFSIEDFLTPEALADDPSDLQSPYPIPSTEDDGSRARSGKIEHVHPARPSSDLYPAQAARRPHQSPSGSSTLHHLQRNELDSEQFPELTLQTSNLQVSQNSSLHSDKGIHLDTRQSTSTRSISNLYQAHDSHAVSPVVLVSQFNRGDSPARSVGVQRSLSKRSRLSDHSSTAAHDRPVSPVRLDTRSSGLHPPRHEVDEPTEADVEAEESFARRSGLAPELRDTEFGPSLKDLEEQEQLNERRGQVEEWLAKSADASPVDEEERSPFNRHVREERLRSRSTGARPRTAEAFGPLYSELPGPGVLIYESEREWYSDEDEDEASTAQLEELQSPPAPLRSPLSNENQSYFPSVKEENEDEDVAPDEPLPRQFLRRSTPQQRAREELQQASNQPFSSNAAIYRFQQQAQKWENASRAATWGTGRRASDSEIASLFESSARTRHLSLRETLRTHRDSVLNKARSSLLRRSSSQNRRHPEQHSQVNSPVRESLDGSGASEAALSRPSTSSKAPPDRADRVTSLDAPRDQRLAVTETEHDHHKSGIYGILKRARARTDASKNPGLAELMRRDGGPPVTKLPSTLPSPTDSADNKQAHASPVEMDRPRHRGASAPNFAETKMDMSIRDFAIIPTPEGFKEHAQRLNPRIEPFLLDRMSKDQFARYKKLVRSKTEHTQTIQRERRCKSGPMCFTLGGKADVYISQSNVGDTTMPLSSATTGAAPAPRYRIGTGPGPGPGPAADSDGEEPRYRDGEVVTPALFPPGIPLPPVSALPATFECTLCFEVKTFKKPSDWTKHVHEDVQPFSCTFPECNEPKSFKRKADWVRHENERHRHLEWWLCNQSDCNHRCYRKDNFIQHLVREHKMNEPKVKGVARGSSRGRAGFRGLTGASAAEEFWRLVESCRHETTKTSRNEPCKFCGNVLSSWKKLSVHVSKHMEQIAMPVLDLVNQAVAGADAGFSPGDMSSHARASPAVDDASPHSGRAYTPSLYNAGPTSLGTRSPAPHPHMVPNTSQAYQASPMHPMSVAAPFATSHMGSPNYGYEPYEDLGSRGFMPTLNQTPMAPNPASSYGVQATGMMPSPYHPTDTSGMSGPMYHGLQYYSDTAYAPDYTMGETRQPLHNPPPTSSAGHAAGYNVPMRGSSRGDGHRQYYMPG